MTCPRGDVDVAQHRRHEITFDIFDAASIFECMERLNEEAIWLECLPEWSQGEDATRL